jgi:hypothetical protein
MPQPLYHVTSAVALENIVPESSLLPGRPEPRDVSPASLLFRGTNERLYEWSRHGYSAARESIGRVHAGRWIGDGGAEAHQDAAHDGHKQRRLCLPAYSLAAKTRVRRWHRDRRHREAVEG